LAGASKPAAASGVPRCSRAAVELLTRDEWAARISKTWHGGTTTMVDAIIAVARELDQAKDELGYGEYLLMFEKERVPFGYKKGNMFIGIAKSPKIFMALCTRQLGG
jgi:hypothetical protein